MLFRICKHCYQVRGGEHNWFCPVGGSGIRPEAKAKAKGSDGEPGGSGGGGGGGGEPNYPVPGSDPGGGGAAVHWGELKRAPAAEHARIANQEALALPSPDKVIEHAPAQTRSS